MLALGAALQNTLQQQQQQHSRPITGGVPLLGLSRPPPSISTTGGERAEGEVSPDANLERLLGFSDGQYIMLINLHAFLYSTHPPIYIFNPNLSYHE